MTGLILPAFIAGVLTFLAPCTLPLIPGYLGFISGVSLYDLEDRSKARHAKRAIFLNGLYFAVGFSFVFIIFGGLAGIFGSLLAPYQRWLRRVGGLFVMLFGFFMLDIVRIPLLSRTSRLRVPALFERGTPKNSLILGMAFALGWTPCVGPVLGSVLALAAVSATLSQGLFLLLIFSLGLMLPFLLIAASIGSAKSYIEKASHYFRIISFVGGAFLIFIGILLFTDSFVIWNEYFFKIFRFIGYNRILDYL